MRGLLSTRLIAWIGAPMTLLFAAVIWLASQRSAQKVLDQTEEIAREKTRRYAGEIDNRLARASRIPMMHARAFEAGVFSSEEQVNAYLRSVVAANLDIYGSCLAFEPDAFGPNRPFFAPYGYWKPDGTLEFVQIGNAEYNHFRWPWYTLPKAAGRMIWTEPYFDDGGGNILMTTCSVPFNRDGKFWGVATIDISLDRLTRETARFKLGSRGYAFIVSQQGRYIAHPDPTKIMQGSIQDANSGLAAKMLGGEGGFVEMADPWRGEAAWIAFEPIQSSGFSLALVYPRSAALRDAYTLRNELIGLGVFGMLALGAVLVLSARSISRPLVSLAEAANEVASGNFACKIDPAGATDEVRNLAFAFNKMTRDLQRQMEEVRYTTTLKERLEGELAGARHIQMSLLPRQFPEEPSFTMHAIVRPAREVGGDFYDFYRLDVDRLVFLIGDVSGKGIPAALFMAVTKTLLKATAVGNLSTPEIVTRVNNELCAEADAGMFVTLLYALLNTATGEVELCNAGHLAPIIAHANGEIASVSTPAGTALGLMRGMEYASARIRLSPGDTLFTYTDGVTEALDRNREFYSTQRLVHVLRDVHTLPVERVTLGVVQDVHAFSADQEQSDDISVLAVRWNGPNLN